MYTALYSVNLDVNNEVCQQVNITAVKRKLIVITVLSLLLPAARQESE